MGATLPNLIGRDADSAFVDAIISRLPEAGGALLVRGEAGIGKSALLERGRVNAVAAGAEPLVTVGVESETELTFAGLHQVLTTFEDVMDVPAWKAHQTWYLVATKDEAIPPDAERMFAKRMGATTVEVASSHLAMVSKAGEVVRLIKAAAENVSQRAGAAVRA